MKRLILGLYYKIRLLFKSNFLLGILYLVRKIIFKRKFTLNKIPNEINNVFPIKDSHQKILSFFESNKIYKEQLSQIADDFINDDITIFHKKIKLSEFSVDKWKANIQPNEIHLNDTRFYWEIYRAKYLFSVGLSYYLTQNEAYSKSLIDFIKNWENYSPVTNKNLAYNGMEAALKLINLSWLDFFLRSSKSYDEEIRQILIYSLVFHATYIYRNYDISLFGLESNHSLSCSVGLIYASQLFPQYKKSNKWYRLGIRSLKRILKKQFSHDGVNFESSVQYHRFTFELLIFLLAVFYTNNLQVDPFIERYIKKIGEALKALSHKNNYISRIGDNDGGKLLYDSGSIVDFNNLQYLNWFSKDNKGFYPETLLFLNIPKMMRFLPKSTRKSKVGSYISYKDSNISLIITGNEIGTSGKGNHQHNDFLSFELYSYYPFLVDCWSYCYTGNRELRNQDRKTISHNNIQIDGREIIEFNENKLFEMLGNIKISLEKIIDDENKWIAALRHNGYKNLKNGKQIHVRKFNYDKKNRELKITDFLSGKGEHVAKLNLHIPQKYWKLEKNEDKLIFRNNKEEFTLRNNLGKFKIEEGFISENFLNQSPSFHASLEAKYMNQIKIESTINYKQKMNS